MSKHVSRCHRWWTPDPGSGFGCSRVLEGYVFQKDGLYHGMLIYMNSRRYIGSSKRLRGAQMLVEHAIECERRGVGYPPVRRYGDNKRHRLTRCRLIN